MNRTVRVCVMIVSASLLSVGAMLIAGPLNPPAGPVAPTYKTLVEVEPRVAVNATNTPGSAGAVFRITQAGSYYLTGNVIAPAGSSAVIEIIVSGVSLDLGGFLISGAGIAQNGVRTTAGVQGVKITNGFISGCLSHGVTAPGTYAEIESVNSSLCAGNGIDVGAFARVRGCATRGNSSHGIRVGSNSIVADCITSSNVGNGIEALSGTSVIDCVCEGNGVGMLLYSFCSASNCRVSNPGAAGSIGFQSFIGESGVTLTECRVSGGGRGYWFQGGKMTLTRCSASGLTGGQTAFEIGPNSLLSECRADNNSGHGFLLFPRCHAANCAATQNAADGFNSLGAGAGSFVNCTATGNTGNGFNLSDGATVQGCTANDNLSRGISMNNGGSVINCTTRNNQSDGIAVNFSCLVRGNSCNGDGTGIGFEAAVRATGQANRIEGNNITFADRGILVSSGGNTIFGNSLKGCVLNFDIAGGNDTGPIGNAASATSPWANIQY
ncbi:MAG: right-handed parallel beta-helix repeat-containing protein [Phycisphaerales bacterium]